MTKDLAGCDGLWLRCIADVELREWVGRSNVDHVFVSSGLRFEGDMEEWQGTVEVGGVGKKLSDAL